MKTYWNLSIFSVWGEKEQSILFRRLFIIQEAEEREKQIPVTSTVFYGIIAVENKNHRSIEASDWTRDSESSSNHIPLVYIASVSLNRNKDSWRY